MFLHLHPFLLMIMGIWGSMVTKSDILLTFQTEQNGTFLDNSKDDYWILHKRLVWDGIFTIFHKISHISENIESPYFGAPFPLCWPHLLWSNDPHCFPPRRWPPPPPAGPLPVCLFQCRPWWPPAVRPDQRWRPPASCRTPCSPTGSASGTRYKAVRERTTRLNTRWQHGLKTGPYYQLNINFDDKVLVPGDEI